MSIPPIPHKPQGRGVVAANGMMVSLTMPRDSPVPPGGVPGDFDPEVRDLHCAAPEMLTALEGVLLFYSATVFGPEEQQRWEDLFGKDVPATTRAMCDAIRRVIAKAKGGAL